MGSDNAMRRLQPQPTLVDQVYEAILSEISSGKFARDARLIQEELAESLGVSRQPPHENKAPPSLHADAKPSPAGRSPK